MILKQYCEYRSGSNLIKLLIDKYISGCIVYPNKYGHKHNFFNQELWDKDGGNSSIGLLISIKHPYSWIVSRAKWQPLDDHKFIPSELTIKDIDNDTIVKWCEGYNEKYIQWFNLPYWKFIIKYEELITNPTKLLQRLCDRWNLKLNSEEVRLIDKAIYPGEKLRDEDFDISYYTEHRYLYELNENQRNIVKNTINWNKVGYFYDRF